MKRVKVAIEPVIHVHKYIVAIYKLGKCKFKYCVNLKEVKAVRKAAPKDSFIEVYSAVHNYREAWIK